MTFWRFCLACLLLPLCGCVGDGESEDEMVGVPPWHLWGNSKTVLVPHSIAIVEEVTQQLTKVDYGRPDTWDFLFGARIIDVLTSEAGSIGVHFDVTVGLGRDHFTIRDFEVFQWYWVPPPNLALPSTKWSTQVLSPSRSDVPQAPENQLGLCTEIVAQQINVQARLIFGGGETPDKTATVEIYNFWAPKNHVRPEWFLGAFPGGEQDGH